MRERQKKSGFLVCAPRHTYHEHQVNNEHLKRVNVADKLRKCYAQMRKRHNCFPPIFSYGGDIAQCAQKKMRNGHRGRERAVQCCRGDAGKGALARPSNHLRVHPLVQAFNFACPRYAARRRGGVPRAAPRPCRAARRTGEELQT